MRFTLYDAFVAATSRGAIIEVLARGRGRLIHAGPPSPSDWRGEMWEGLSHTPEPDTVRFLKSRAFDSFELFVIEYEDDEGKCQRWTCRADREQGSSTWRGGLVSGGGCDDSDPEGPWANLGGAWGRDGFTIGGRVHGDVARVELEDRDGQVYDDSVVNGYVLLGSNEAVRMPLSVVLFDPSGAVVARQEFGF